MTLLTMGIFFFKQRLLIFMKLFVGDILGKAFPDSKIEKTSSMVSSNIVMLLLLCLAPFNMYVFIFGCAGSLLLHRDFL